MKFNIYSVCSLSALLLYFSQLAGFMRGSQFVDFWFSPVPTLKKKTKKNNAEIFESFCFHLWFVICCSENCADQIQTVPGGLEDVLSLLFTDTDLCWTQGRCPNIFTPHAISCHPFVSVELCSGADRILQLSPQEMEQMVLMLTEYSWVSSYFEVMNNL